MAHNFSGAQWAELKSSSGSLSLRLDMSALLLSFEIFVINVIGFLFNIAFSRSTQSSWCRFDDFMNKQDMSNAEFKQ